MSRLRLALSVVFLLFYAGYITLLLLTGDQIGGPVLLYVILGGVVGTAVDLSNKIPILSDQQNLYAVLTMIVWKLMVAGILSVFCYVVFASGLIQGSMFPQFQYGPTENSGAYSDMETFLREVKPKTNPDMAKVLVWSFMAGFSEKFFSGFLRKLESSEDFSNRKSNNIPPPGSVRSTPKS